MKNISAFDYKKWKEEGLQDFQEFADFITFINQDEDWSDTLCGEWWYAPEEEVKPGWQVIYCGSFSNSFSPGASCATCALLYNMNDENDKNRYMRQLEEFKNAPEYVEDYIKRISQEYD